MLTIDIPEYKVLTVKNMVLDFNGTMAFDGVLLSGVKERLNLLAESINIYVLTADTFGTGQSACQEIKAEVHILSEKPGGPEKKRFVEKLGAEYTVAVGNGANDALMLAEAALGILILGPEGISVQALLAADVVVRDIVDGLDLLLYPKRLIATLRR